MNPWYALNTPAMVHITLWLFVVAFIRPLNHRPRFRLRILAALAIICISTTISFLRPLSVGWHEVTLFCVGVFLTVLACCRLTIPQALYGTTWIMVTHQLTMEGWIIFYAFTSRTNDLGFWYIAIGLLFNLLVCVTLGLTVCRWLPEKGAYKVGPRQLSSALILLLIFEANYCALLFDADFPNDLVRLFALPPAQLYCVCTLYFQNALFRKSDMQRELDMLNRLRYEQQAQYDLARENIAIINRKCHDMKHQIAALRTMASPADREKYLSEIEKSVNIYDSILNTGNEVLDTVLTQKRLFCEANHITIHCVADGSGLSFMDPVDIFTIMGNAMDNAIEHVQQLTRPEQRIIDVLVCVEKNCLVIQVINPLDQPLDFADGLPVTTKGDEHYHGFGLKSIRHTVEQYGGHLAVRADKDRFSLKILIPL